MSGYKVVITLQSSDWGFFVVQKGLEMGNNDKRSRVGVAVLVGCAAIIIVSILKVILASPGLTDREIAHTCVTGDTLISHYGRIYGAEQIHVWYEAKKYIPGIPDWSLAELEENYEHYCR